MPTPASGLPPWAVAAIAWLRVAATGARRPVASQAAGVLLALAGLYLLVGVAVTLIVAGVVLAALGTLREAGWI